MRQSMKIIVLGSLLTLVACGQSQQSTSSSGPTGGIILRDSTGAFIGDVATVGQNMATVYTPQLGEYVTLNLSTGQYNLTQIFYANTGCTGQAAGTYNGVIGKSVIYGNGIYYQTTTAASNYPYQSYWYNGSCTNASANMFSGALLNVVSQPQDFSKNIPLTLNFN
jgi:hypothetical protein